MYLLLFLKNMLLENSKVENLMGMENPINI
jgi:hypothetical protein